LESQSARCDALVKLTNGSFIGERKIEDIATGKRRTGPKEARIGRVSRAMRSSVDATCSRSSSTARGPVPDDPLTVASAGNEKRNGSRCLSRIASTRSANGDGISRTT
jgi:hypothetical protein